MAGTHRLAVARADDHGRAGIAMQSRQAGGVVEMCMGQQQVLQRPQRHPDAADVALDADAPRFSRIAGESVSARQLADIMTRLTGVAYKPFRPGGLGLFSVVIALVRALSPKTDEPFPAWQGMQYMRDMASGRGKLTLLDNARYGKTDWTSVANVMAVTDDVKKSS
jgi:hypothetical protein